MSTELEAFCRTHSKGLAEPDRAERRADAMAEIIREYVERQIQPLRARIAELESHGVRYRGTWRAGESYRPGDMTTHDGAMWACREATTDRPPSGSWTLAVQRGRDR